MVDLPDTLKKDLTNVPPTESAKEIAEALKAAEIEAAKAKAQELKEAKAKAKPEKAEKASPDELVLKPKQNKKKLQSALDRIKALARIEGETKADAKAAKAKPIKGNIISKGSSLSGDAKEGQASYLDTIRGKLQENWELPVWLSRQNLNAQVRIFIDPYGRMRSYKFMKPSGNAQFDAAIKKTLQDSQPYPAPPEDVASALLVDGVLIGFPL